MTRAEPGRSSGIGTSGVPVLGCDGPQSGWSFTMPLPCVDRLTSWALESPWFIPTIMPVHVLTPWPGSTKATEVPSGEKTGSVVDLRVPPADPTWFGHRGLTDVVPEAMLVITHRVWLVPPLVESKTTVVPS